MTVTIAVPHFSKHQKKDHARILRGNLPPEVEKRLRARLEEERAAAMRAAADAAIAQAEALKKAEEDYKRTLPERIERERQARFLANAERVS